MQLPSASPSIQVLCLSRAPRQVALLSFSTIFRRSKINLGKLQIVWIFSTITATNPTYCFSLISVVLYLFHLYWLWYKMKTEGDLLHINKIHFTFRKIAFLVQPDLNGSATSTAVVEGSGANGGQRLTKGLRCVSLLHYVLCFCSVDLALFRCHLFTTHQHQKKIT